MTDERAYCPRCGNPARTTEWNIEAQRRSVEAQGLAELQRRLNRAKVDDVRRFNRRQPADAWIKLSLSHRPGALPVLVPIEAAAALRQKLTCEACACRYATLGTAFFCPLCGHNSAVSMFVGAVNQVRQTMDALPTIRTALEEAHGANFAEDAARRLVEDGLENLVTAFQRYAEAL